MLQDYTDVDLEEDVPPNDEEVGNNLGEDMTSASTSTSTSASPTPTPKCTIKRWNEDELLSSALNAINAIRESKERKVEPRDECDVFGELIAMQLRAVEDSAQRDILKFNVMKLFVESKVGTLNVQFVRKN